MFIANNPQSISVDPNMRVLLVTDNHGVFHFFPLEGINRWSREDDVITQAGVIV